MPFWKRDNSDSKDDREKSILKLRELTNKLGDREDSIRQMTERIINERNFLHLIMDNNPSLIFVKDVESRFIAVNDKVAQAYGLTREEILGKKDSDIFFVVNETPKFHENDQEVILNKREKLIPIEPFTNVRGETRYYSVVKTPIIEEDGSCRMLLGVATDITHLLSPGCASTTCPVSDKLRSLVHERIKAELK